MKCIMCDCDRFSMSKPPFNFDDQPWLRLIAYCPGHDPEPGYGSAYRDAEGFAYRGGEKFDGNFSVKRWWNEDRKESMIIAGNYRLLTTGMKASQVVEALLLAGVITEKPYVLLRREGRS